MRQLFLLELPEGPGLPEEPPPDIEEAVEEVPQLIVPEVARLERIIANRRRRKTAEVPRREPYLPGDRGDPPRRAGKIQPRRFSMLTALKAVPGLISEFFNQRVPDEFWSRDADSAGPIAVVACPCGEEIDVPETRTAGCSCGRWYFNGVDRVLVGETDLSCA